MNARPRNPEPVAGQRQPRDPGRTWLDDIVNTTTIILLGSTLILASLPQATQTASTPTVHGPVSHATTHIGGKQ